MRPKYDGVKIFSNSGIIHDSDLKDAKRILDAFDPKKEYSNINEVIELYIVYQIITSKGINPELVEGYKDRAKVLRPIIARFFNSISEKTFIEQYNSVCFTYIDEFWELFEKHKVFKNISESAFAAFLQDEQFTLYQLLEHKAIVHHYDAVLAKYMRFSDQTAEILSRKFLERRESDSKESYLPPSLEPSEFERIFDLYIASSHPNVGHLQVLASSQSSKECPISDELRLKARKKVEEFWKEHKSTGGGFRYGIGVCFKETDKIITVESIEPHTQQFTYDIKWILENTDYPTLLNNFIYLFGFTDQHFRCTFPVIPSQLSSLFSALGVKGKKEYVTDVGFSITEMKSTAEMNGYIDILLKKGIRIEDVYQWFFEDYLRESFGVEGFVFHAPTQSQSILEKCRNLPAEMDGVLKQYQLYVKNGEINRELLEMSSSHIVFSALPSMTESKYAYANSKAIQREQFMLFSDQCLLGYLHDSKKSYGSFFKALSSQVIKTSDYQKWQQKDIVWLAQRGTITVVESNVIQVNIPRVLLLRDLYMHGVLCPSYYKDKTLIDNLVRSGDLLYTSTLLSIPEQQYLNYILNKSEFSNGRDLRNKYIHSTCSLDEKQQLSDYITLLRIMAVIIIKINEEFCLRFPEDIKK